MSAPFIFLQISDPQKAEFVDSALRESIGDAAVTRGDPTSLKALPQPPKMWILDAEANDGEVVELLRERRAHWSKQKQTFPKTIVLLQEPRDARRTEITQLGAQVSLVDNESDLPPLLATVANVLENIGLQEKVESTAERFRVLVESSNEAIYILQRGCFAYVNARFEELVNIPAKELLLPDFSVDDDIISDESKPYIEDRMRRIDAGEEVESRYEFVSLRRGSGNFDAEVSISYIEFEGDEATLGIVQDITERKRFENQLVQVNHELELKNALAISINESEYAADSMAIGCRHILKLLDVAAVGITLVTRDKRFLHLNAQEGLNEDLQNALSLIPADGKTLLAKAVVEGQAQVVDDISSDARVRVPLLRSSGFQAAAVIPMLAKHDVIGALFVFTRNAPAPGKAKQDLLASIGTQLGNATEKAALLEQERDAMRRLKALDEIALTVASRLELSEVAVTVARSVRRFFGPRRVILSGYDETTQRFNPLVMLDDDQVWENAPTLPASETLLGTAKALRRAVQRVRPDSKNAEYINEGVLPAHATQLFTGGFGLVVALPVMLAGKSIGGILLGYEADTPLDKAELEALSFLSTHVAIAMRNAELYDARNQALQDLQDTQEKLVQNEKLHALGEIAAGVAHDFNNVLGAILGRTQLLRRQISDPQLLRHTDIIEKAAVDGAETVRRIQEIGRQDATDDFLSVEVHSILDDVKEITLPKWKDLPAIRGISVDVSVVDETKPGTTVFGNPHELREVLINLVHNAIDAMPSGGALVLRAKTEDSFCELSVEDSGKGIPDDVKSRIFDPFFTTKGSSGTGLGLSVSYSIMQRHKGDISVESVTEGENTGTAFRLRVPLAEPAAFVAPPTTGNPTVVVRDLPPDQARVLVIDDEENIRDILTDILTTGGHEVEVAQTGPDGLTLLDDKRFDLVFTDLGLPGMSGYEVAEAVKARFPTLKVGLVTGWGAILDPEKVREHGVDLVLSKPFRFDQVLGLVDEVLEEA
ncbi:MAG: response regulator [Deltaproteobacteria bacterium]|nr:response regulator [Deltaproteobacteria bacterium]